MATPESLLANRPTLLTLPSEIRIKIYEFLIEGVEFKLCLCYRRGSIAWMRSGFGEQEGSGFLSTCHQVHDELLPLLEQKVPLKVLPPSFLLWEDRVPPFESLPSRHMSRLNKLSINRYTLLKIIECDQGVITEMVSLKALQIETNGSGLASLVDGFFPMYSDKQHSYDWEEEGAAVARETLLGSENAEVLRAFLLKIIGEHILDLVARVGLTVSVHCTIFYCKASDMDSGEEMYLHMAVSLMFWISGPVI